MEKRLLASIAVFSLLFFSAAPVGAQTGGSDDTAGTTGALTTTPRDSSDDAVGTRGGTMGGPLASEHSLYNMRSESVVGKMLYGAGGEEIGEIDRVVYSRSAMGPEAVVGVGGFLGIGERDVTIPLAAIAVEGDRLVTTMSKDSIAGRTPYADSDYDAWDDSRTFGTTN
jgi:hypothetical protein